MPKIWRNYDLSKLSLFITKRGQRLRGHGITFKRFGFLILWLEDKQKNRCNLYEYDGV